jgi:hypothetical protein
VNADVADVPDAADDRGRPLERMLLELVHEVAPRKGAVALDATTDLGFDGFRMTILEYLSLLERVEARWGVDLGRTWPHTISGIAELLEQTSERAAS